MFGTRAWNKVGVRWLAAGLALGAAASAGTARAGTVLQSATGPGGHRYEVVVDQSVSWSGAKAAAEQAGGFLATIGDQQEQSFVEGLLSDSGAPSGSYWFGLHETATEGDFRPLSGVALNYSHFLAGQPDNNQATVGTGENSGSVLWANAADVNTNGAGQRRGFWNDLPDVNPTTSSIYPDLVRGGYLVEFKGTGPNYDNGDGDHLLAAGGNAGGGGGPSPVPLPAAVLLFPAGAVAAVVAGRRLRRA
jgi:hypothetical protein